MTQEFIHKHNNAFVQVWVTPDPIALRYDYLEAQDSIVISIGGVFSHLPTIHYGNSSVFISGSDKRRQVVEALSETFALKELLSLFKASAKPNDETSAQFLKSIITKLGLLLDRKGSNLTVFYAGTGAEEVIENANVLVSLQDFLMTHFLEFHRKLNFVFVTVSPPKSTPFLNQIPVYTQTLYSCSYRKERELEELTKLFSVTEGGKKYPISLKDGLLDRFKKFPARKLADIVGNKFISGVCEMDDEFRSFDLEKVFKFLDKIIHSELAKHQGISFVDLENLENSIGMDSFYEDFENRQRFFTSKNVAQKGVLLVGNPGTGKTLAAKHIAKARKQELVSLNLSACLGNGLVGQAEKAIQEAVTILQRLAPCCVLIDEVDKNLSSGNSTLDSGVGSRQLSTLLKLMNDSTDLYFILTANRPQLLPPELTRKGRLDSIYGFSLPNSDSRKELFDFFLKEASVNKATMDFLVDSSAGATPSEIKSLSEDLLFEAFKQSSKKANEVSKSVAAACVERFKPHSKLYAGDSEVIESWVKSYAISV